MFRFFRQIRFGLIEDNAASRSGGRFSKYMLYALGEIVLVVLGILIALQINNWNNERKDRIESKEIKLALLSDLKKDSIMLEEYIVLVDSLQGQTSDWLERLDLESTNKDTIIKIVQEFDPRYDNILSFNDNTYQSILSSGKLALLGSDIQNKLLEVKNWQAISLDDINNRQYLEYIKEYTNRYPLGQRSTNYTNMLRWEIKDSRDFVIRFTNLCWFKNFLMEEYHRRYSETLIVTTKLINELESKL